MKFIDILEYGNYTLLKKLNNKELCLLSKTSKEINKFLKSTGYFKKIIFNLHTNYQDFIYVFNIHYNMIEHIVFIRVIDPHLFITEYRKELSILFCKIDYLDPIIDASKVEILNFKNNYSNIYKNPRINKIKFPNLKQINF